MCCSTNLLCGLSLLLSCLAYAPTYSAILYGLLPMGYHPRAVDRRLITVRAQVRGGRFPPSAKAWPTLV